MPKFFTYILKTLDNLFNSIPFDKIFLLVLNLLTLTFDLFLIIDVDLNNKY